jgi:hypothetical protein
MSAPLLTATVLALLPLATSAVDGARTAYLDVSDPAIASAAAHITAGAQTPRERAVRIHDFVRDEIAFGFAPALYDQRASEVLRSRVGFCTTKSTLFVALLRASGIPARQHFVDIDARVLLGLIDPGTSYVDHSYAEVRLAERWLRVDSFILDPALAQAARARLAREGLWLGYGAHRRGVSDWDGASDAFSQFVDDGSVRLLSRNDYGVFDDVGAFYASGVRHNRLSLFTRLGFPFFARGANARIEALRAEVG